jgi:hypothetical protein
MKIKYLTNSLGATTFPTCAPLRLCTQFQINMQMSLFTGSIIIACMLAAKTFSRRQTNWGGLEAGAQCFLAQTKLRARVELMNIK